MVGRFFTLTILVVSILPLIGGTKVLAQERLFSPDSKTLATANDKGITLWDTATGKARHRFQDEFLMGFSPDSRLLFTTGFKFTVKIWHADTGKKKTEFGIKEVLFRFRGVSHVVSSPDNTVFAAVNGDGSVTLWNSADPAQKPITLRVVSGDGDERPSASRPVPPIVFSPDSKTLVTTAWDGTIKLWDAQSGKERAVLVKGGNLEMSRSYWQLDMSFPPDGKSLVIKETPLVPQFDSSVTIWDLATGKTILDAKALDVRRLRDLAFTKDGMTQALVVVKDKNPIVILRDLDSGKQRVLLEEPEYSIPPKKGKPAYIGKHVLSTFFSGDGKTLLISAAADNGDRLTDQFLKALDVASGKPRFTATGDNWNVRRPYITADGGTIVAQAFPDGRCSTRVWDTATGKERLVLKGGDIEISPDGSTLYNCGNLELWDTSTGQKRAVLMP